jgi:hypothetical protein
MFLWKTLVNIGMISFLLPINPIPVKAIAQLQTELGFDVILLKDVNLRQMGEALDEFHAKLRQGGVGVFYYAGHGMQVDGENYLIPIDAKLERKQDTAYEALAVGKILRAMEDAANNVNIIMLDACRDNLFTRRWQRSNQPGGLAPVQAVRGSYIRLLAEVREQGTGNREQGIERRIEDLSLKNYLFLTFAGGLLLMLPHQEM